MKNNPINWKYNIPGDKINGPSMIKVALHWPTLCLVEFRFRNYQGHKQATLILGQKHGKLWKENIWIEIVIDDTWRVPQWGHDFRPDYFQLKQLRHDYPDVPMMALTATATSRTRTDILSQLKMTNTKWFISSFNRSNLQVWPTIFLFCSFFQHN